MVQPAFLRQDSLAEQSLDGQSVIDDAASAFGRVQRALLVADDADHRVAGLALVRREHPRLREVLGEVVVAVAMG